MKTLVVDNYDSFTYNLVQLFAVVTGVEPTVVIADGVAHLQAGAGIVADSVPADEHRECLSKLAAIEAAIDLAEAS